MSKKFSAALASLLVLFLLFSQPATAKQLVNQTITTALTGVTSTPQQFSGGKTPNALAIQCNFTYGSGGTTAKVWVQTSLDGATWTDIANVALTTSSARRLYNLSALTPVTTVYTPTDGTLADNTAKDGIIGPWLRTKITTTGTYAGGTSLTCDATGAPLSP